MNENKTQPNIVHDDAFAANDYEEFRRTHGDMGDIDDFIFGSAGETKTHSEK